MVRVVCLDAEKRAVKMMEELHQMKRDKNHCDFIVQVGNDIYHTHKNVLSAGSDYFKAMLKYDTKESREGTVAFKDVDSECVKSCIDSIYSSKFEIPDGKIIELLHVAIMMQLEDVTNDISNILAESITVENYFSTRNAGYIYGLDDVSSVTKYFLERNIMEIATQDGFRSMENNDFLNVLKSTTTELWEEEKVELSLKWIEGCEIKKKYLYECLELIDLYRIPPAFLQYLETHPIIRNDFKSHELIRKHLMEGSDDVAKQNELLILFDCETYSIRSFNPITEKISKFHNAKFRQFEMFNTILLDSYIYILSHDSVHRLCFRRKNSEWEKTEGLICDHGMFPCSVSLCGSIFVIGGSYGTETNCVERFDPAVNHWFQLQHKPTATSESCLVSLNDSVYCIGGRENDVAVSSFCKFTPSSSEWVALEPMRYPVARCGVVAVDQKIFVIGGYSGETINNVECYDVASAQWTSLSWTYTCRDWATAAYLTGKWIFVVDLSGDTTHVEKYDLSSNKWYNIDLKVRDYPTLCGFAKANV